MKSVTQIPKYYALYFLKTVGKKELSGGHSSVGNVTEARLRNPSRELQVRGIGRSEHEPFRNGEGHAKN
jgi:hypothetical protein